MQEYRLVWFRKKWHVRIGSGPTSRRISLRTTDRHEADRRLAALKLQAARPSDASIASLWNAYVQEKTGRTVLRTMDYTWKGLAPRFGHLTPDLVTVDTCRDYIAHRRQQVSDGTIHTELGHLSTVLNWAVKRELIDRAPHVERPAKPAPRDRWLTRKDAMKVIDAASFPHLRLSMILLVGTAARVGAILDLTWDRVDLERGQINLTRASDGAKRKQRATVPINGMVRAALVEAQQGAVTDHVIEWSGKPVASIKKGIAAAAKRAGVEGVSAHVFRHTAAVWMAEANVPMARIAQYLGHRDSRVTERIYARFAPDHLRDEAEILSLPIRAASSFDQ